MIYFYPMMNEPKANRGIRVGWSLGDTVKKMLEKNKINDIQMHHCSSTLYELWRIFWPENDVTAEVVPMFSEL